MDKQVHDGAASGDNSAQGDFNKGMIHRLENDAYYAVLRAFKAQSGEISREKAILMKSLQKELNISFGEQKHHLSRIEMDEVFKMLRGPTLEGEDQEGKSETLQSVRNLPLKKRMTPQKGEQTSRGISVVPKGKRTPASHGPSRKNLTKEPPESLTPSLEAPSSEILAKEPPEALTPSSQAPSSEISGKEPPESLKPSLQAPFSDIPSKEPPESLKPSLLTPSSEIPTKQPAGSQLIGRKIWIRLPGEDYFEEAVITEYNADEGLHALKLVTDDSGQIWGWVDLEEMDPEDIKWDCDNLKPSLRACSLKPGETILWPNPNAGKGKASDDGKFKVPPPPVKDRTIDTGKKHSFRIKFRKSTTAKKAEEASSATPPDPPDPKEGKRIVDEPKETDADVLSVTADASKERNGGEPASQRQDMAVEKEQSKNTTS